MFIHGIIQQKMAALNIYDTLYFRLNKKLLRIIGLWPYDSKKKIVRAIWITLLFLFNVPHFIGVMVHISDLDKLMEHMVVFLILVAAFLKHFTLVMAEDKMKSVYNDIAKNWLMISDEEEKKILVEYSRRGRLITIIYTVLMTFIGTSFMLLALVPEILNVISPLPTPRSHIYILNGEFLVDNRDEHFYKIYLWDVASVFSIVAICIGVDPMYMVVVEHASALYAVVTYRLTKLRRRLDHSTDTTDSSYQWLLDTVKLHQTILSFTRNINDTYSACFFCLTLMNLVDLPVNCVVVIIHWHNPMNFIRYALVLSGLMQHLFVLFWPGQKLIDHSIRLVDDAYCNDWYETPARTKKLLQIFMIRCSRPCLITAGGLVEMNFVVYFKVVKTAASYITVLASFR